MLLTKKHNAFLRRDDFPHPKLLPPTNRHSWHSGISCQTSRTDAIVEGETIGYGLSIDRARFGVWVSDVTVLSDLDGTDLDDLIEEHNEDCEDMITSEPWLNHLSAWESIEKKEQTEEVRVVLLCCFFGHVFSLICLLVLATSLLAAVGILLRFADCRSFLSTFGDQVAFRGGLRGFSDVISDP